MCSWLGCHRDTPHQRSGPCSRKCRWVLGFQGALLGKVMGLKIWRIFGNMWQLRRNRGAGHQLWKGLRVVPCCGSAVRANVIAAALSWGSPADAQHGRFCTNQTPGPDSDQAERLCKALPVWGKGLGAGHAVSHAWSHKAAPHREALCRE